MPEPEEEISAENPPVHYFPDKARPDYTPFSATQTQKFVHISPERLQKWATERGVNVDPEDLASGVILIGPSTMNHRDLLINNLNLSRDPKHRLQADEFGCENAGFIVQIDNGICALAESSGDLSDETGRPFFGRSEANMAPLHEKTAARLNEIYWGIAKFS